MGNLAEQQYRFAGHIRDPEHNPAPVDVEDRRMQVYRELFYNNVEGFLAGTFPVLRRIFSDTAWHRLTREYFACHRAQTPLFLEMPREFLNWLESEYSPQPGDPAFLLELAHYEWVELAVSIAEDSLDQPGIDPAGDLLGGIPVISPLAWHMSYRFPVHRIGPDFMPCEPDSTPTHLVVYRDPNDEVGFIEINAVTKRLLELIGNDENRTGKQLLQHIAGELSHPQPGVVINAGTDILRNLLKKHVLLGTKQR